MAEAPTQETVLQTAGEALAAGAWSEAYRLLLDADRARLLVQPNAIMMLAESTYLAGSIEAAIQAHRRPVAGQRDRPAGAPHDERIVKSALSCQSRRVHLVPRLDREA